MIGESQIEAQAFTYAVLFILAMIGISLIFTSYHFRRRNQTESYFRSVCVGLDETCTRRLDGAVYQFLGVGGQAEEYSVWPIFVRGKNGKQMTFQANEFLEIDKDDSISSPRN